MNARNKKIVVAHVIYRLGIGGLERVMINCINAINPERYQHVVIALTEIDDFAQHLHVNQSVELYQLNKKNGKDFGSHWRLFKLLRTLKPDVLHSYNLAAIEYHVIAQLAGVQGHIHAEHGREVHDPHGLNKKHNLLRKLVSPFIDYYVAVSTDLAHWLKETVGISEKKIKLIRNGINLQQFKARTAQPNKLRFIHIARCNPVKDQATLISAFHQLVQNTGLSSQQLTLTIVGDGELLNQLKQQVKQLGLVDYVTFTGARNDIATLLQTADVFVLSSIAEGIPMTVLEAMAAKLAIIATNVGGLAELVTDDKNGYLVQPQQVNQLTHAMNHYVTNPEKISQHGHHSYQVVSQQFDEVQMINSYSSLYDSALR